MEHSQLNYAPLLAGSDAQEQLILRRTRDNSTFGHKYSIASDTTYAASNKGGNAEKNGISKPTQHFAIPDLKIKVCEVEGCGLVANAGCCTYRILAGVSKGCGRNFCSEHSGSSAESSDFQLNNYDDFRPAPNSFDEELGSDRDESHNRTLPFEGQVCSECRPSLRRAYKLSAAILCGIPAAISVACVFVYGGSM